MRELTALTRLILCLGFTGSAVAWADPHPELAEYVEDPMAPHHTSGNTVRLGTAVGFLYGQDQSVLALGGTLAAGHRFGRLAIEAEYTYLAYQVNGPSTLRLGDGTRLGVIGRYDVLRIGPEYVGGNSLLSFYVEGGAAVAWNDWYEPAITDAPRSLPADSKRVEAESGFGVELDHRLQEPIGFPRRVGWFLGWRMGFAPHAADDMLVCRGSSCRTVTMPTTERYTDRSMLFQSSLAVTW